MDNIYLNNGFDFERDENKVMTNTYDTDKNIGISSSSWFSTSYNMYNVVCGLSFYGLWFCRHRIEWTKYLVYAKSVRKKLNNISTLVPLTSFIAAYQQGRTDQC